MHRIYTSMALVIDTKPYAEADHSVLLYTKDFGLIRAIAKGVRLEKSKLRYSLTPYSLSEVSLVKGKEVWRLTSATFHKKYSSHPDYIKKIILLVKRVSGEETPDLHIYQSLQNYFEYLNIENTDLLLKEAEISIALHILNRLGYIPSAEGIKELLVTPFSSEKVRELTPYIERSVGLVNQALKNTHL